MNSRPRGGILLLGTDRIRFPMEDGFRRKLSLLQSIDDHYIIAYGSGRRFERTHDGCHFLLVPSALPFLLRVPTYWLASICWTWRLVFSRKVTVLISQSPYDALILFGISRVASLMGRRPALIVQVQGDWEDVLPLMHRSARWTMWLWKLLMRLVVRKADVVRAVSGITERRVRALGVDEVVVFPTWTDFDLFISELPSTALPSTAGQMSDFPSALYAGVLTPVKGVDTLLQAASIVQSRGVKLEVIVAGEGPEGHNLRRLAKDLRLDPPPSWKGHVSQPRLLELFDKSTVFVLPSRTEGLPRVVIEAMARAKPVIATTVGGIPDLVSDGRTGILVKPDDPLGLANAIVEVLESPEKAATLGRQAQTDVTARFGTQGYLEGYSKMLALADKSVAELD